MGNKMIENMKKEKAITVVIIEDYTLTRVGLIAALNQYPHINVIGEASDGQEGIEVVNRLKPDVVLMDLGLAGMIGKGKRSQKVCQRGRTQGTDCIPA